MQVAAGDGRGLIWHILSVWSIWSNQIYETNQTTQRDQSGFARDYLWRRQWIVKNAVVALHICLGALACSAAFGSSGQPTEYLTEVVRSTLTKVSCILEDGTWHAYDLVVDGVSLVKNYRSQFEKIIRASSYHELVRRLGEHTVGESKKKQASRNDLTGLLRYSRDQTLEMA